MATKSCLIEERPPTPSETGISGPAQGVSHPPAPSRGPYDRSFSRVPAGRRATPSTRSASTRRDRAGRGGAGSTRTPFVSGRRDRRRPHGGAGGEGGASGGGAFGLYLWSTKVSSRGSQFQAARGGQGGPGRRGQLGGSGARAGAAATPTEPEPLRRQRRPGRRIQRREGRRRWGRRHGRQRRAGPAAPRSACSWLEGPVSTRAQASSPSRRVGRAARVRAAATTGRMALPATSCNVRSPRRPSTERVPIPGAASRARLSSRSGASAPG